MHGPITRVDQPALAYRSLAAGELQLIIKGKPLQLYRIEGGKLAETWLMFQQPGSAWPDAVAQEHWTSPPPVK